MQLTGETEGAGRSIGETFLAAAAGRPADAPWLTLVQGDGRDQPFSTSAVRNEALAWQAWFAARLPTLGERVTICLEPSLALYASFMGAILAGAVPSIFAPPSGKQKMEDSVRVFRALLDASGSRILVTTVADFAALAGERLVAAPHSIDRVDRVDLVPARSLDAGGVAFVQYSSGTTGLKKGVAITHTALIAHVEAYARSIGLDDEDRIVSWLPLYHDMGLITALFMPLLTGAPLIAMSPLDWASNPTMLLAAIERHRATRCWQPNFAYNFLAKFRHAAHDLSSMRLWVNCSERVMNESHQLFLEAFAERGVTAGALGSCYAMAENVFAVASGPASRLAADAAALAEHRFAPATGGGKTQVLAGSGRPLPDVSVRILGPEDHALPEGRIGEIAIRTPWLFDGYAGAGEARFADRHFLTGDTGFVHAGELFVLGRRKDILIIAGRNLYPQDIEALVDEVEGVVPGRCAAFAVPDAHLGTEALVILAESRETDVARYPQIVQDIRARVAAGTGVVAHTIQLTRHMSLIKATSGKISRGLNREAYLAQVAEQQAARAQAAKATAPAPPPTDLRGQVRTAIVSIVSRKPVGNLQIADDTSLFELGVIDSLSFIELILELERTVGRRAPEEMARDAQAHDSVNAIVACFKKYPDTPAAGAASGSSASKLDLMRQRRLELAPQFGDTDGVLLEPLPYVMLTPTRRYSSPTANSDPQGFRVAIKNGEIMSRAQYSAMPGDRGIVLGNSMSWGTGSSDDAHVIHNVLNREMTETAWYSFALRQSVLTQERLAANLFAPLDLTHIVWITGSVLVMNSLTAIDHTDYLPFPAQMKFETSQGYRSPLQKYWTLEDRKREIIPHIAREMALLSRIYAGARNRLFVWQPTLMHYNKPMGPEERELVEIARQLPGKPSNPSRIAAQSHLSRALAAAAKELAPKYGLRFVEPSEAPAFRSSEWLFVDPEHLNDAGVEALAEVIRANLV